MKSALFMGFALGLTTLTLTACGGGGEPAAEASPDSYPGIKVTDARLVLPAVKGNPAAAYFDVDYEGSDFPMIRAASVAGAQSTTMHATTANPDGTTSMNEMLQFKVEPGKTLEFAPGGNHLMVMGLPDTVEAGDKIEITLTFVGGDKTSFDAEVRAPGNAD